MAREKTLALLGKVTIMRGRFAPGLNFAIKAVLSIAGVAAVAAPDRDHS